MAKDRPSVLSASSSEWDQAWDVVRRLGAAHKPLESETGAIVKSAPDRDRTEPDLSILETFRARPPSRPSAVWILIGALWISIGMIVSATIVTVAFLA